jgi:hypothetical protein
MQGMKTPSDKRMLVSLAMIAIGCVFYASYFFDGGQNLAPGHLTIFRTFVVLLEFAGAILIGAGIGNIFKQPGVGMMCGVVAHMFWVVVVGFQFVRFLFR